MPIAERWLVTGARGFLGRRACAALRARGHRVVPLDHHPPAQEGGLVADLATGPPDLGDPVDVVVHLASLVHHRAEARAFERAIVDGTANLLEAVDRLGRLPRAVLYASTVAVYGPIGGELLPETTAAIATSPYGGSKRRAETILAEWAAARGVRTVALRLPALVGAGMAGSLSQLVRALARRRYVGIGPGTTRRSLVLATDVAAALPRLAAADGVLHLTDRAHPSFLELERAICRRLGRRAPPRIPIAAARLLGRVGDLVAAAGGGAPFTSEVLERTITTLTFDDRTAVERIGWSPTPVLERIDDWMD
jgi:nucleoside-diphosphate-sugar epimerase